MDDGDVIMWWGEKFWSFWGIGFLIWSQPWGCGLVLDIVNYVTKASDRSINIWHKLNNIKRLACVCMCGLIFSSEDKESYVSCMNMIGWTIQVVNCLANDNERSNMHKAHDVEEHWDVQNSWYVGMP